MKRLDPELRPLFWRQLAGLLAGGLPLSDALLALGRDSESRRVRDLTESLRATVADGEPLSVALERSGAFDDTTVACLRAAEASDRFVAMCRLLADNEERSRGLRLRARMVLAYPVVLWFVGLFAASGLAFATIGLSSEIKHGLGFPFASIDTLLSFALLLNVVALLAAVVGLVATFVWRRPHHGRLRTRLERLVLRVPVWSRYWQAVVVGRFLRGLGALLESGVPFDRALELAGAAAGSRLLVADVTRAAAAVRDGGSATASLGSEPLLSPAALWTLRSAEARGDLVESVRELAAVYDESAEIGGATALTVLEPTAIVIAGSFAALLVLAIAIPLFNLSAMVP